MAVIERIHAFLKTWPDAEFGPGHIVLSDYNVEDGHVRWCLALIRAALSGRTSDLLDPDDAAFMKSVDWFRRCDTRELEATRIFLEELLTIPEAIRIAETEVET